MRLMSLFILTLGLLALPACSNAPTAEDVVDTATEGVVAPPRAEVVLARVVEQTDVAARVIVTVLLTNPNAVDLPLTRADYTLRVGEERYRGRDVPHMVLPASGMTLVELPAVIASAQPLVGQAYRTSGTLSYQPPGEVRELLTEYRVPLPTTGFSGSGALAHAHETPRINKSAGSE